MSLYKAAPLPASEASALRNRAAIQFMDANWRLPAGGYMKIYVLVAACVGALVFTTMAQAIETPIPGINIVTPKETPRIKPSAGKSPTQNRSAITTSRSNIKHQGSAGPVPKDPLPATVNTSRSNIKHGVQ
jgi:hypothetical protein